MNLQQQLINEAKSKGFEAREFGDSLIVSLNRKVYKSEVVEAMNLYDHEVFVQQAGNEVLINLSKAIVPNYKIK